VEIVGDAVMARDGFERLGPESSRVTSLDQDWHTGIDGIYYKPSDVLGQPGEYRIVDQKYKTDGNPKLSETADGTQLSINWISSQERIDRYFDPDDMGIRPADQEHYDALTNYMEHADEDSLAETGVNVTTHMQSIDGDWQLTDTIVEPDPTNARKIIEIETTQINLNPVKEG
jgi:hypothetical protein